LRSIDNFPAPIRPIAINPIKYKMAFSLVPMSSLAWYIKPATNIVIITGIAASRVLTPNMINIGHIASPITAKIREAAAPIPIAR